MNSTGIHKGLLKYLGNTVWLLGDKVFRMFAMLISTIWMARYLGPERYGIFSYCLSFVSLFTVFTSLGLDKLLGKEFVLGSSSDAEVLGSSLAMRLLASMLFFSVTAGIIVTIKPDSPVYVHMTLVLSSMYFFRSFEVIRLWFEARVLAKYSVPAQTGALFASTLVIVLLILLEAPLAAFAYAFAAEWLFLMIGLTFMYGRKSSEGFRWDVRIGTMKRLIGESWPLILAGSLYMAATRIDQIMLGDMVSESAVGIYAAAVKISEGWLFVPAMITTSFFTAMLNAKRRDNKVYAERTQHLLNLIAAVGILAAIAISLLAKPIILLAFGEHYRASIAVLEIHVWGGVFSAVSTVVFRYLIAEGLQRMSFYRGLVGLVINIVMNFMLIPAYGVIGAAVSTVVSQCCALYLFNATNGKTRAIFLMQTRALTLVGLPGSIKYVLEYRK